MHGECTTNPGADCFERTSHVALLAKLPEASVVHVVNIVATDAGTALRHFARHGLVVARFAGDTFVSSVEREGGLFVVIETPGPPRRGVVAGFAPRPKRQLVLVIFLVAGDTRRIRVLESGGHVALLAFDADMLAEQREAGQTMVDPGYLPVAFVVTGFTFPAFLSFVRVILFMAGDAGSLQLLLEQESRVATVALGLDVLAAQDEFGVAVVIKFHGLPAFFHVAGLAPLAKATLVTFTVIVGFMARHACCF